METQRAHVDVFYDDLFNDFGPDSPTPLAVAERVTRGGGGLVDASRVLTEITPSTASTPSTPRLEPTLFWRGVQHDLHPMVDAPRITAKL